MMNRQRTKGWQCQVLVVGFLLTGLSAVAADQRSVREVDSRIQQANSEPVAAEAALMARLDATRMAKPDQSDRIWLRRLIGYQSKAMVAGEHGAEDLDALYPIANAAQGLLNRLDRDLVRSEAASLIDQPSRFLDQLTLTGRQSAGYLDAALAASPEQRKALRTAASKRLNAVKVADLAGELALHDAVDAELLQAAFAYANPVAALHWLRRAEPTYGSKAAMAIYQTAQARGDLSSAAQLHAAGNPHLNKVQRERWLRQLSDPRSGGSAAMALAKSMDADLASALAAKARSTASALERKRLLLALSQSVFKSGGAVSELRGDSAFLAKLDEETRAWFVN